VTIAFGLLRAVDTLMAGVQHHLREGSEEENVGDIRPGFRGGQVFRVFCKKVNDRIVVALAEEVGLATSFFGERAIEGKARGSQKKSSYKSCENGMEDRANGRTPALVRLGRW